LRPQPHLRGIGNSVPIASARFAPCAARKTRPFHKGNGPGKRRRGKITADTPVTGQAPRSRGNLASHIRRGNILRR
jgi:hypothetical protein